MTQVPLPLRRSLLGWFDDNARDLPWRRTRDPYRIWVSEIMLQQTRVETVIPYYVSWLERFPTVEALARAPLNAVLEAWTGLGYYSRARNLHKAAGLVCEVHEGRIPDDVVEIRGLPGVGHYTSGAIASIAFDRVEAAVDGNVRRVLSRLLDLESASDADLRSTARSLVDPNRPGDFNQALMELGALVCRPRAPRCDSCPLARDCTALTRGTVLSRPVARGRKPIPHRMFGVAVLIRGDGRTLLRRRPASGLLGGMLEFPNREVGAAPQAGSAARDELCGVVLSEATWAPPIPVRAVEHVFSHFKATYLAYLFRSDEPMIESMDRVETEWADFADLNGMALPAAQRNVARAVLALEESRMNVHDTSNHTAGSTVR